MDLRPQFTRPAPPARAFTWRPLKRRLSRLIGPSFLAAALIPHCIAAAPSPAEQWSAHAAETIVAAGRLSPPAAWNTESGLRLQALEAEWYNTARGDYFNYARQTVDAVLADPNWNAPGRSPYADALLGQQLMLLYRVTQKRTYYEAAKQLHQRLAPSCGLDSHPEREWLPCRAQTFLAEYAAEFQQPADFASITRSLAAWDASAASAPAGKLAAPEDRLFSVAWMAASLSDSLASFPTDDLAHDQALAALRLAANTLARHQNPQSGILHLTRVQSSAAAAPAVDWLFVYALEKGVRLGYLPPSFGVNAVRAWRGALARYVRLDSAGHLVLSDAPPVPGNSPFDNAGQSSLGAFLLASTEMDLAPESTTGHGAIVLLDAWYNSQQRKNAAGQLQSFHYKWTDWSDSGYSLFAHMLRSAGLRTETLAAAPTPKNLQNAGYYLIVSPDIPAKNPTPHYMTSADADVIAAWVRRGGVLMLMENDPPNADIQHLNLLADRFGIHFDDVLDHHILGEHVEAGTIPIAGGGSLFPHPHTIYMKDTCAISLQGVAVALLRDRGDVVMATARYGRGTVFAAVDPWLYNEYTDGRKNPAAIYSQFDNFAAGKALVQWLVQQRPQSPSPAKQKGKQ